MGDCEGKQNKPQFLVEHVGFEPLFFRAREICYQLHHMPQNDLLKTPPEV